MLKAALITALVAVLFWVSGCGGVDSDDTSSPSPPPAATGSPTPHSPPPASEHFTRANWDVLATDPESHIGATTDVVGRVWSTVERDHEGMLGFVMDVETKSSEWETKVALPDSGTKWDFGPDDYVRVKGTVRQTWTSDTQDAEVAEILASSISRVERPQ